MERSGGLHSWMPVQYRSPVGFIPHAGRMAVVQPYLMRHHVCTETLGAPGFWGRLYNGW